VQRRLIFCGSANATPVESFQPIEPHVQHEHGPPDDDRAPCLYFHAIEGEVKR